jgi:nitroimidazol reductase NimA-like FMN-containing flavoprotein (pyridoxamine 5'-phosphate oxidase superfamily)
MLRELTAHEAKEVLTRETTARLCFFQGGRPFVVNVTYRADGWCLLHLLLAASGDQARTGEEVCVEVDRIHGPGRWETVVGWGELVDEPAPESEGACTLKISRLRGFGRTPERRLSS